MPRATLTLVHIQPRMLKLAEAAEYCGRSASRFKLECPVHPAEFANGDLRWDVRRLDEWLDSLETGSSTADEIIERL